MMSAEELPGSGGWVPTRAIRPALELAWEVARAGLRQTPPIMAPTALRPLLNLTRLARGNLETLRLALEADPVFRARVVVAAQGSAPGAVLAEGSWLWLAHPPGWQEQLGSIVEGRRAREHDGRARAEEQRSQRDLAGAEAARVRSDEEAAKAKAELAATRIELVDVRAARRAADAAAAQAAAARRDADERLASAAEAVAEAERRARAAEERVRQADDGRSRAEQARDLLADTVVDLTDQLEERSARLASGEVGRRGLELRHARASNALFDAAAAAGELAEALGRAGTDLAASPASGTDSEPAAPAAARPEASAPDPSGGLRAGDPWPGGRPRPETLGATPPRRLPAARRRPPPLPPGLRSDSVEAAALLVRLPRAVVLVDGYNVSLATWPQMSLEAQRHALVAELDGLAARTAASVQVVFDAPAEEEVPPLVVRGRSAVRTRFSATGQDADEVLVDEVDRVGPDSPVLVVTDDRRVRAAVEERGALALSVWQLRGVLGGRSPQPR